MIRLGKNKKRTHVIYPCEIKKYKGFLFECFMMVHIHWRRDQFSENDCSGVCVWGGGDPAHHQYMMTQGKGILLDFRKTMGFSLQNIEAGILPTTKINCAKG
jgi:hypothetical protein